MTGKVILGVLAVAAVAAAGFAVERGLRERSGGTPGAVILPAAGDRKVAKTVQTAADALAALGEIKRDTPLASDGSPAFDVARVEPSGDTVIAGRAAPGATVELLRNGKVHDKVVADASGQFALVPPKLPTGDSELTLRARPAGGGAAVTSRDTVVVSVPENLKDQPVVALMSPDKPSVVLSKPGTGAGESIVVESVEAGGRKLYVTGRAVPGALVRLYVNDTFQSTATAGKDGRVAFTTDGGDAGSYRVRLDDVDRSSGSIRSRAEVPFTAPQTVAAAGGDDKAGPGKMMTVSRGDSLWRISRLAYGDGARYTVIYDANHNQIRNPDRIYPGQVFMIPGHAKDTAGKEAAASREAGRETPGRR